MLPWCQTQRSVSGADIYQAAASAKELQLSINLACYSNNVIKYNPWWLQKIYVEHSHFAQTLYTCKWTKSLVRLKEQEKSLRFLRGKTLAKLFQKRWLHRPPNVGRGRFRLTPQFSHPKNWRSLVGIYFCSHLQGWATRKVKFNCFLLCLYMFYLLDSFGGYHRIMIINLTLQPHFGAAGPCEWI